ncbi:peptidase M20 domain protein [Mycobacterium xenopi 4042]|uniref:Peptidase M20 domain protein n=1 Tax=Mycobacterium xenopi 4042 TaxID=1299334 RepID=X8APW2_MYCXE|nr:peptidase M20 domain protein [Mycobacterium xenopi 4042]
MQAGEQTHQGAHRVGNDPPTGRNAARGRGWRPRPRSRPARAATPSAPARRYSSCPSPR